VNTIITRKAQATQQARLDYVRERLRLLYVGITRARKELIITWNTGRKNLIQGYRGYAVTTICCVDWMVEKSFMILRGGCFPRRSSLIALQTLVW